MLLQGENTTVRSAFKDNIYIGEVNGKEVEIISQIGLLEGIKSLGIDDLTKTETACVMKVLSQPEIGNAILLNELLVIMSNFGLTDGL